MKTKILNSFYKKKGSQKKLEVYWLTEGLVGLRIRNVGDTTSIVLDEEILKDALEINKEQEVKK